MNIQNLQDMLLSRYEEFCALGRRFLMARSRLLVLIVTIAAAICGVEAVRRHDRPDYSLDASDIFIDAATAGKSIDLSCRIRNLSKRPIRLVGGEYG